jgi:competence protein ComEC
MKSKTVNAFKWIVSIFLFLFGLACLTLTPFGITIFIPALMINPSFAAFFSRKTKSKIQWWQTLIIFLVCFSISVANSSPSIEPANSSGTSSISLNASGSSLSGSASDSSNENASHATDSSIINSVISSSEPASIAVSSSNSTIIAVQNLSVHYIDVGQGDSIFVELPNGETMLIDAGESEYGSTIAAYIKDLGYNGITYLIATHPHADHIGGMAYVISNLEIQSIYMPKATTTTQTYEGLLTTIQSKGLKIKTAKAGVNIFDSSNLKINIIAPNGDSYDDLNNYSAVIKLVYGDNSFLFMGDAETLSENEITADVKTDVLKVGHHGSNSSTGQSFLQKVSPKYAVISVGAGNSYGHPTEEVLNRLVNAGAAIYRTDQNGTITFISDGKILSVNVGKTATKDPVSMASSYAAVSSDAQSVKQETINEPQSITVYITNTGEKYHLGSCRYLKKSKIAISLSDAKARGYTPCSVCHPPS